MTQCTAQLVLDSAKGAWKPLNLCRHELDLALTLLSGQSFRWHRFLWRRVNDPKLGSETRTLVLAPRKDTGVSDRHTESPAHATQEGDEREDEVFIGVVEGHVYALKYASSGSDLPSSSSFHSPTRKWRREGVLSPHRNKSDEEVVWQELTKSITPESEEEGYQVLRRHVNARVPLTYKSRIWAARDEHFSSLYQEGKGFCGVRAMRVAVLETVVSFICSSNNNIKRITQMIESFCALFPTNYLGSLAVSVQSDQPFYFSSYVRAIPPRRAVQDRLPGKSMTVQFPMYAFPTLEQMLGRLLPKHVTLSSRPIDNCAEQPHRGAKLSRFFDPRFSEAQKLQIALHTYKLNSTGRHKGTVGGHRPQTRASSRTPVSPTEEYADTKEHLGESLLREIGFGFRAPLLVKAIASLGRLGGEEWLQSLAIPELETQGDIAASDTVPISEKAEYGKYRQAREELMQLSGVGPKVADCICLCSLGYHFVAPVDTHCWQLMQRHYLPELKEAKALNAARYELIHKTLLRLFGSHAGWAFMTLFAAELADFRHMSPHYSPPGLKPRSKHSTDRPSEVSTSVVVLKEENVRLSLSMCSTRSEKKRYRANLQEQRRSMAKRNKRRLFE
mmetsp:Transcript_446/g.1560  ORF Transcript_446/g.1560 Transcript_446/m.1560 type:complete len:616 (-) Transcript_446:2999-4846(-)